MHKLLRAVSASVAAFASALLATVVAVPMAMAQNVPDEVVRAEILGGWQTERGTRMVALRLTLAPGWKTYWRAPGDAGIPPHFDWRGSRNLSSVAFHWPAPSVFHDYGMRTIGYADELVLPMELRPERPGAPIRLSAEMELGVCETVCIPASLDFTADLRGSGAMDPAIRAALARTPTPGARAGVRTVTCRLTPNRDGMQLDAKIEMPQIASAEIAVVEAGDPSVWVAEPQVARAGGALHLRTDLVPAPGRAMVVDRSALRFTVIGAGRAVDIRGCS